jgi:hypothetical protein
MESSDAVVDGFSVRICGCCSLVIDFSGEGGGKIC